MKKYFSLNCRFVFPLWLLNTNNTEHVWENCIKLITCALLNTIFRFLLTSEKKHSDLKHTIVFLGGVSVVTYCRL